MEDGARYPGLLTSTHHGNGSEENSTLGTSLRKSRADGRTWIDEAVFSFLHIYRRYRIFFTTRHILFRSLLMTDICYGMA
jgi:hypothetical protein